MQNAEGRFVGVFERYWNEGYAEGYAEERGEAKAVLKVLAKRGLDVPDDVRDRVLGCTDQAVLDRLLERAITVTNAKELLE